MKIVHVVPCLFLLAQSTPAAVSGDAVIELENPWLRVVRVQYNAHEKTAMHDHPATPTVYVYVTDGGRLRIEHGGEEPVIRPVVKAGGIRFQKGVFERHTVEELDGVDSQYIRIELKTQPVDLPTPDVRRAPADRTPYESGMIRIMRVTCAAQSVCPASMHPEDPSVVVTGKTFTWMEPNAAPMKNASDTPMEQVRVELKTPPLK
jgi:hypothetical protein